MGGAPAQPRARAGRPACSCSSARRRRGTPSCSARSRPASSRSRAPRCSADRRSRASGLEHSGARLLVADRAAAPEARAAVGRSIELIVRRGRLARRSGPRHRRRADARHRRATTSRSSSTPRARPSPEGRRAHARLHVGEAAAGMRAGSMSRPGDLVWCTAGTGWAKSIWNVPPRAVVVPERRSSSTKGGFDAEERFDLLQRLGVTVLCQASDRVPADGEARPDERFDLGRLRHAVSAGEPAQPRA